tara:strand:- start:23916 stop:24470 length:555 start_codon:yes stop_codon:yes gene_type:complete
MSHRVNTLGGVALLFSALASTSPSSAADISEYGKAGTLNTIHSLIENKRSKFLKYNKKHSLYGLVMKTKLKDSREFDFTAVSSPFNPDFLSIRFIYEGDSCQYVAFFAPKTKNAFNDNTMPYHSLSIARVSESGNKMEREINKRDRECQKDYLIKKDIIEKRLVSDLTSALNDNLHSTLKISGK